MDETLAPTSVRVTFRTQLDEYRISDAPLLVPINLRRYGLSEVINHILGLEKPIPFDILVGGKILRTSILGYLNAEGLNAETTLELEYVLSIKPPHLHKRIDEHDWVSSVACHSEGSILVGSYDGTARVWSRDGARQASTEAQSKPVKCVSWGSDRTEVFSGSQNSEIIYWERLPDGIDQFYPRCKLIGHRDTVMSLAFSASGRVLVSSSWDRTLKVWNTDAEPSQEVKEVGPKRRRLQSQVPVVSPVESFEAHRGAVSRVQFEGSTTLFSAGWDGHVRKWDCREWCNYHTMTCDAATYDMHSVSGRGVITSHGDGQVRVWDFREGRATACARIRCTQGVLSAVRWSPSDETRFVTGDFGGKIRFWDTRSTNQAIPLFETCIDDLKTEQPDSENREYFVHTLERDEEDKVDEKDGPTRYVRAKKKILGMDWAPEIGVCVGTEDSRLRIFVVQ